MSEINENLRRELLAMQAEDLRVREELAATGELFDGYNPTMEAVHVKNAGRLEELIDAHGWLGERTVGADGAEAAWIIAQHAIGLPDFSRRVLKLLETAVNKKDAPAWQAAYLQDRINFFEGKPQLYGSQFDWNERGEMQPHEIFEPENIDARRAAVGLSTPYSEVIKSQTEAARNSNEPAPQDLAARERGFLEWARRVGWRA